MCRICSRRDPDPEVKMNVDPFQSVNQDQELDPNIFFWLSDPHFIADPYAVLVFLNLPFLEPIFIATLAVFSVHKS